MDINVGDRISIHMIDRDDTDLAEWLDDNVKEDTQLVVTDVEYESGMCWIQGCEYGIDLSIVEPYNGTNYTIVS